MCDVKWCFRNDELNLRLRHDIEKLNRLVTRSGGASTLQHDDDPPEIRDLKVRIIQAL